MQSKHRHVIKPFSAISVYSITCTTNYFIGMYLALVFLLVLSIASFLVPMIINDFYFIIQDFAFILKGITRLLNNPLMQTYLPGSCKKIQFHQELLVLFWKMCDINKVRVHGTR